VDDNIDSATSLQLLLRMWDHEVQLAHDGLTALTAARDFRPEVILLDIGLPKLDGFQVARQVRQEDEMANVLLVAMTGYGQEEDRRRTQDAGFDHHLVKPVDLDTLQELLRAGAAPGRRERQRAVLASR
jgi:CheY-like chemotaxis protein